MKRFKNITNAPVPFQVGDEVIMIPPGGEYVSYEPTAEAEHYNAYQSEMVSESAAEAFAAAAFRAATGNPVEPGTPEIEQRNDPPLPAPAVEVAKNQVVKGAKVTKTKEGNA